MSQQQTSQTPQRVSRRRLLQRGTATLGAVLAAPWIAPASALGRDGTIAPSERIVLAAIGHGGRGRTVLGGFLRESDVQCVALCDCFADRRAKGKAMVDQHYGNTDCAGYGFHEDIFERRDIDTVLIAAGDRWHTPLSVLAARAGKDVYCEKPFCLTIAEGRELVETTKRYGTVWQCGTQRRSVENYRIVVDAVRSGKIGKLHTITASFGGWGGNGFAKPDPIPEGFEYDRWLGQAPWVPHSSVRVKYWRNHWDTGAGPIADMGPHMFDFAQWVNDSEGTGPVEFEGEAVFPNPKDGFANVPFDATVRAKYADGIRLLMDCQRKRTRFDGDEGWIELVDDTGQVQAGPKSVLAGVEIPKYKWSRLDGHIRNFLNCIRSRELTVSHPETAHRSHTIAHCANIALRLGRGVRWDPEGERFVGDNEANRMLRRAKRAPWQS
jgi:predicted dehydrogenase